MSKGYSILDGYSPLDVITGTAVTVLTQAILDRRNFPNPTGAQYLTPAFAVAFFTGLGAVVVSHALRNALHDTAESIRCRSAQSR